MILIFTGNGKGKTTAALGQALRAVGDGERALMVQFIKGPWKSGEDASFKRLLPDLEIVKRGKGFVGILGDTLPFDEHAQAAQEALSYALGRIKNEKWNILILDEIWNALHLRLISREDVSRLITEATPLVSHLILTGRDCPEEFIRYGDIVTEMREIKHAFSEGASASKGIEY